MLIEREEILSKIEAALDAAGVSSGSTIVVDADPGLGKTALLVEAAHAARTRRMQVLSALGGELEQGSSWGITRELLASAAAQMAAVRPAASAALGQNPSWSVEDPVATGHALTGICAELADAVPMLLLVDDAHWADQMSARWLAYLAPRVRDLAIVLVIAARPTDPARPDELDTLAGQDGVSVHALDPLSEEGSKILIRRAIPQAEDPFIEACQSACGGSPFLLSELVREIAKTNPHPDPSAVENISIGRVDSVVARRLRAAGTDGRDFARAVAVLGQRATLADAAAIAQVPDERARECADELRASGLLSTIPDDGLRYTHPLLRSAVERAIPSGERSTLHLRAARHVEHCLKDIERVGAHLLLVAPGCEPWTQQQLIRAGNAALASGAAAGAVALFQRAVAERAGADGRELLLAKLGSAAMRVDPRAAEAPLRGALAGTQDPARRVAVALQLAVTLQTLGRSGAAVAMLSNVSEELARSDSPRALRLRIEAEILAQAFFDSTTRSIWGERLSQAVAELTGDDEEELLIVVQQAVESINRGTAAQARDLADRAWGDGLLRELAGSPITPTVMWIPYIHLYFDDYQWTIELMGTWLEEARHIGSAVLTAFAYGIRAEAEFRSGALAAAAASAQAAWSIATELDREAPPWWIAISSLAQALLATGRPAEALELLESHGILDGAPPQVMLVPLPRAVRAEVLLANGRTEQGVSELSETLRWLEAEGEPSPGSWRFLCALIDGLLALGRRAEAGEVARDWRRRTRRFGTPSTHGMAQRAVALCQRGMAQIDGLRIAEKTLAPSAARAEHARSLLDLGASLRRAGQRKEAREPLRVALDLATRCGAIQLADRAHVELVACGARPRRALLSGTAALTPSERRVAQMAAEGLTNREIANGLFVSPKTVERHLTNIFVKLEINDRGRLPELMAQH